ncbi:hypothetical protein [Bradyrhizobium sp. JYMT SZCCT0428]|uniref:hypothetical protein n=1 Tax=Bradyrhizobium sp. JYMT SZCCT0428 TaxID=2807673 RepID=UPI002011E333|nr:hypothetical protein [Bradyrhizobium sp. JYMT SZCCT0428]
MNPAIGNIAHLARPVPRIAQQPCRPQQPLLQHELRERGAAALEQQLNGARAGAVAPREVGEREAAVAEPRQNVGLDGFQPRRGEAALFRQFGGVAPAAEHQHQQIHQMLRNGMLRHRIEARGVLNREVVISMQQRCERGVMIERPRNAVLRIGAVGQQRLAVEQGGLEVALLELRDERALDGGVAKAHAQRRDFDRATAHDGVQRRIRRDQQRQIVAGAKRRKSDRRAVAEGYRCLRQYQRRDVTAKSAAGQRRKIGRYHVAAKLLPPHLIGRPMRVAGIAEQRRAGGRLAVGRHRRARLQARVTEHQYRVGCPAQRLPAQLRTRPWKFAL